MGDARRLTKAERAAADHAVRWINQLTHTDGPWAGQPFNLRPWQERIVRTLFGTLNPDGTRQYRTCYVEIPRKNGKTELAAAIALYMLLGDGEQGAQVYVAASDLEQASLAYHVAQKMIEQDTELPARLEVIPSRRRIVHQASGSFFRAIPADAPSAHGYNASCVICDELHAWPDQVGVPSGKGKGGLYEVLRTSFGARKNPLLFIITTAGYDKHSLCYERHRYAEQVRDGVLDDPTFLPVLYGAPDDADWQDERVWKRANPALGDFRSVEDMRGLAREAAQVPGYQNGFRRLFLCQWTESESRWLDMAAWDQCAAPVDLAALEGRLCYAGLDLSRTQDLTAFVLVFPDDRGGYDIVPYCWVPAEKIADRVRRDRVPYDQWLAQGFLRTAGAETIDYDVLQQVIEACGRRYRIARISYDKWNAAGLVNALAKSGAPLVEMGQGFPAMSNPAKELERLVLERALRHGGHPVLRWCIANTVVKQDPDGNLKPAKDKSTERIDAAWALILALDGAMREAGQSVYDTRARAGERALTLV